MSKNPPHRPYRRFPGAPRLLVECELDACPHCGGDLKLRRNWHMRKMVQTMAGPRFVAGKSKECVNPSCSHPETNYYASGVLRISLPKSTYGLDVLAYIGWQHEREHKQFVEIQCALNARGILINERNVGKLYRQFMALLGAANSDISARLDQVVAEHGGLILGVDALQPEGHGSLLYVLYEVLSMTVVSGIQLEGADEQKLAAWLDAYQHYPLLATLCDGEERIIAAMRRVWPDAPQQRCQEHFLGNLAEDVSGYDTELRKKMRQDLGGLPKVPGADKATPPF